MSKPGDVIEIDHLRPVDGLRPALSPLSRTLIDKASLERSFIRDEREAHEKNLEIMRAASYAVHSLRIACGSGRVLACGEVTDEIESFIVEKLCEANNAR